MPLTTFQELLLLLFGLIGVMMVMLFYAFVLNPRKKKKEKTTNQSFPSGQPGSLDGVAGPQQTSAAPSHHGAADEEIRSSLDYGSIILPSSSAALGSSQAQVALSPSSRNEIPENKLKNFDVKKLAPKTPVVGLVGFSGSGKTVFCATLNHFINSINKDSSVWCSQEKGSQYMEQLLDALLVNHIFPEKTQMGVSKEIELKIHKGSKSVLMQVNDISGEVFDRLKNTESTDWAYFFLTQSKSQNALVGPYAYLLYSKAYVIAIDCASYTSWGSREFAYITLLSGLAAAKRNQKFEEPLMFLFTKADTLPPEVADLDAEQLLGRMRGLQNYAREHFNMRKVKSIKVFLDADRDAQGFMVPKIESTSSGPQLSVS